MRPQLDIKMTQRE